MSEKSVLQILASLSDDFKVESAYSMNTHVNVGKAFNKAEHQYKQAAVKWHHSVAKVQMVEHKKHTKAGNTERATDALKWANKHKQAAEKIDSGELHPTFRVSPDRNYL